MAGSVVPLPPHTHLNIPVLPPIMLDDIKVVEVAYGINVSVVFTTAAGSVGSLFTNAVTIPSGLVVTLLT